MTKFRRCVSARRRTLAAAVASLATMLAYGRMAEAGALPEIRLSNANPVPACVTPERLMSFLKAHNGKLDPRYKDLAGFYKNSGEAWRVRWDYAFFQMAIETNFLTYRRPDGRMGDVDPKQNNFAGIGTTGGGVAGDSYPDIKTGVLAQIQHLVVYSGEKVAAPVAPRTQLKQDDILAKSHELNRPVRYSDLAHRWAVDRKYDQSIEWAAGTFRTEFCKGAKETPAAVEVLPWSGKKAAAEAGRPGASSSETPRTAMLRTSPVRTIWTRPSVRPGGKTPAAPIATVPPAVAASEPSPSLQQTGAPPPASATDLSAEPSPAETEPISSLALIGPPAFPLFAPVPAAGTAPASPKAGAVQANFDPAANPPSGLGIKPETCSIGTASYGGTKTILVRSEQNRLVRYIALSVLDGFETSMMETFIRSKAEGGQSLGEFPSKEAALEKARELCPNS